MKARAHLVLEKTGASWTFDYRTPELILPSIRTEKELLFELGRHADDDDAQYLRSLKSIEARRRYIEQVRPALRWFCRRFGVPLPTWLVDDEGILGGAENLLGDRPFAIREFRPQFRLVRSAP